MKKFKYKIEPYFKFLIHQREAVQIEVQKAQSYKLSLEQKYDWLEDEMKKAYKLNSEFGQSVESIHFINDNNSFINLMRVQQKNLSQEIQIAEEKYQEKYKMLLELQMKVKQVELHKEKQKDDHKKERRKKEQKLFDEINSTRKGGRNAESI